MTTMVYGIDQRIGYIHPGGLLQNPISKEIFFAVYNNYIINYLVTLVT